MVYKYRAYTLDKRIMQGTINADSENVAEAALYQAGYQHILSLREVQPGISLEELIPSLFGIKTQDVIGFSNQLAALIESGIPITTALQLLEGQAPRIAFKKVLAGLVVELRGGSSFSNALGKYPKVFSYTNCQVIKASEQAGSLEVGLKQIAGYMEKQAATIQKIRRAMSYPIFVLFIAIGVSALLITVALPPLAGLFTSLGAELPWTTRLLITITSFFINYKFYLLVGLLVIIMSTAIYIRLPSGKITMDRLTLKAPVIGSINIDRHMRHFCQTTSVLLKAGLHLPQIMDTVAQTIGNGIIRQALRDVREKLVQGQGLSQPMAEIALFPKLLVETIAVGEKTGTIDSTLATLADFYEQRVDQRIDILTSMIEPFLTLVIGLVVLFIALSMITPLYSILHSIH